MNMIADTSHLEISALSTEQLYSALRDAAEVTARSIVKMAAIWLELERRGEDMSKSRSGLAAYLPAVASGRLVPEAIVKLAGNRTALRAIACLDADTQRQVLEAGTVAVVREEGAAPVQIQLQHLKPAEVNRAIDGVNGRIIPPAEQSVREKPRRMVQYMARVLVPLTDAERQALQKHATARGKSAADLVRETLRDAMLFM